LIFTIEFEKNRGKFTKISRKKQLLVDEAVGGVFFFEVVDVTSDGLEVKVDVGTLNLAIPTYLDILENL